jgi:hypothetical protein
VGEQIGIVALAEDELELLAFIRSTANVAIFEGFAVSIDQLAVSELCPEFTGHIQYIIWNKHFPWEPTYGTTIYGQSYIANSSSAPVIEFARTRPTDLNPGRIYWAKNFSATQPLDYDVDAFDAWVQSIFKWIRKNGRKLPDSGKYSPYHLPAALKRVQLDSK